MGSFRGQIGHIDTCFPNITNSLTFSLFYFHEFSRKKLDQLLLPTKFYGFYRPYIHKTDPIITRLRRSLDKIKMNIPVKDFERRHRKFQYFFQI